MSVWKTVFLCTQVLWCLEGEATIPCTTFHGSGVKRCAGRSGSTGEMYEWGSTSFRQPDRMALRSNLHDSLECSLCFRNLDSTDVALGVGRGHPPGKCFTDGPHVESFQLCNRRAGGWGFLLGNTTCLGGGFAWLFLLSVETALLCFQSRVVACSDWTVDCFNKPSGFSFWNIHVMG